jgi:hypothetical protein
MAAELTIVKVGKIEWLLANRTPWSRTRANVGAIVGVTLSGRKPSGMNKITLCGGWARAITASNSARKAKLKYNRSRQKRADLNMECPLIQRRKSGHTHPRDSAGPAYFAATFPAHPIPV